MKRYFEGVRKEREREREKKLGVFDHIPNRKIGTTIVMMVIIAIIC
jgi:hypothetical protein